MDAARGRRGSFSDPKKREEARQHEAAQLRAQMLQRKDSIGSIEKALLEAQQAGDAGSDELSSRLRAAETEIRKTFWPVCMQAAATDGAVWCCW